MGAGDETATPPCQQGIDMPGSDLLPQPATVANATACKALCERTSGCVAFVANDCGANATACWLKSALKTTKGATCRCLGLPDSSDRVCLDGVDGRGSDLLPLPVTVANATACKALCDSNARCLAFVVNSCDAAGKMTCWLKASITAASAAQCRCLGRASNRAPPAPLWTRVVGYLKQILASQTAAGWIGPDNGIDGNKYWAGVDVLLALTAWAEIEPDVFPTVSNAVLRHCLEVQRRIKTLPLEGWAAARWMDLALTVEWLIDKAPQGHESDLIDLLVQLHAQGKNWELWFEQWKYNQTSERYWFIHGVNDMEALKSAAVWWRLAQQQDLVASSRIRMDRLDEKYGFPNGMVCADELLCEDEESNHPSRGSELCAVVEGMFSYETMFSVHGNPAFADRAERIAFNALPATWASQTGGDMWNHQYLQAVNLINAMHADPHIWTNDGPDSELYGLEPNYGCCTADFSQGWPRFADMLFFTAPADNGVAVGHIAPASAVLPDKTGNVATATSYPFDDRFTVTLQSTISRPLYVRIPAWATKATATVNGSPVAVTAGKMLAVAAAVGTTTVAVDLNPEVRLEQWYRGAVSVHRGPLLFSYNIVGDYSTLMSYSFSSVDLQVLPVAGSEWRWALDVDPASVAASFKYVHPGYVEGSAPFNHTDWPCYIEVAARAVPSWGIVKNSAAVPPASPACNGAQCGPSQIIRLVPYGATDLRISTMPLASHKVPDLPHSG